MRSGQRVEFREREMRVRQEFREKTGKWGGGRQASKEHSNTGPRTDCPPDSKGPVCPAQAQKGSH